MKKYDLVANNGKYLTKAGEEKYRRENIGEIHEGQYGLYARMNPYRVIGIAHGALARGEDSITVNLYEPRDAEAEGNTSPPPVSPARESRGEFDQDVPF